MGRRREVKEKIISYHRHIFTVTPESLYFTALFRKVHAYKQKLPFKIIMNSERGVSSRNIIRIHNGSN